MPQTPKKNQQAQNMVLIDLNLNVDGQYISESFLWNPQITSKIKIVSFLRHFLHDILFEKELETSKQSFEEIIENCYFQLRTQSLYKTLLKKHTSILLNFSTLEISQDIRQYLIEIDIKLTNEDGEIFFSDNFEWDMISQSNNIEEFCRTLMEDEEIPTQYFSELCYKIKTQINAELQWKFTMLVKTFKSIHKERESPKLNTQTMTQLKKNIIYTMDVNIPFNPDKERPQSNIYLNNSDLFSTLSRNLDILPEEFHEILLCKESSKNMEKEKQTFVCDLEKKIESDNYLKERGFKIEDNTYLGKFTSLYKAHNLWRDELTKNNQTN